MSPTPDTPAVPVSLPLDLQAWARLARAAANTASARWYHAHELSGDTDYREDAEFIAYCTPERILGLIAAAQQGAEDSAESSRQFMRAERNYTGWLRTAEVGRGLEAVIDDALAAMREPMTLADARRARDLLTHAAAERSKANAAAREARAAAPEERDDA